MTPNEALYLIGDLPALRRPQHGEMTAPPSRRSGLLVPLFSFPSSTSWGIGEISDVGAMTAWLDGAGQRVLQLLPINEMAYGQQSPYSAMSAMAIDPIYISVEKVPEFVALGGAAFLGAEERTRLGRARRSARVDHVAVRALKQRALTQSFERFHDQWRRDTPRAWALRAFLAEEAWWLEDYALFRALHDREGQRPWTEWPGPLQRRESVALASIGFKRTITMSLEF